MSGVETRVDQMLDALDKLERDICGDANVAIAVYMARLSLAFAASRVSGVMTVEEIREACAMLLSEALNEGTAAVLEALPVDKAKVH